MPVSNVAASRDFFSALGFKFNEQFSNEESICLIIGENMFGMLNNVSKFERFIDKKVVPKDSNEVIISLACESTEEVRKLSEAAFAKGARKINEPEDHGFMYSWGFEDLDGHLWDLFWMNPEHVIKGAD